MTKTNKPEPWPAVELLKLAFCCGCSCVVGAVVAVAAMRDPLIALRVEMAIGELARFFRG